LSLWDIQLSDMTFKTPISMKLTIFKPQSHLHFTLIAIFVFRLFLQLLLVTIEMRENVSWQSDIALSDFPFKTPILGGFREL